MRKRFGERLITATIFTMFGMLLMLDIPVSIKVTVSILAIGLVLFDDLLIDKLFGE